jgi:hypothetical protein
VLLRGLGLFGDCCETTSKAHDSRTFLLAFSDLKIHHGPVSEPPEDKTEQQKWREALERMVKVASEDPEKFMKEARIQARLLGVTLSDLYAEMQKNPKLAPRTLRNSLIQGVGKRLRRVFGI